MFNNKKIKINLDYIVEKFDGEMLLYEKIGSQAVYLNSSAYAVWLLCKENLTVGQIVECLEKRYPKRKEQMQSDVNNAISMLEVNKVIILFDDE